MKTIGLIGGTTWISTVEYYRTINEMVGARLGKANNARILLYSFNFEDFNEILEQRNWKEMGEKFLAASKMLQNAGVHCILFCANTAHLTAKTVRKEISVPLIHIGEATVVEAQQRGVKKKIGLLGTRFTMEMDFIKEKFTAKNIEVLIPDANDREFIHRSIFDELGKNILLDSTKQRYLSIIRSLLTQGAEGIILGCTEIPLLIKQGDVPAPVFDTTLIHAAAAVEFALKD
ncbi:MAG: aspartate/glutamate racemase family protein [Bacteroidota bacterium]|jgi:aspartate racemase